MNTLYTYIYGGVVDEIRAERRKKIDKRSNEVTARLGVHDCEGAKGKRVVCVQQQV